MNVEVTSLKANMDNLWQCLHALLKRIEQLEGTANLNRKQHYDANNSPKRINGTFDELVSLNDNKKRNDEDADVKVVCNETVTEDPETGIRKRTVVTERVVTTKAFHVIPIKDDLDHSVTTVNESAVLHDDKSKMSCTTDSIRKNGEISSPLSMEILSTTTARTIQLSYNPFREIDYDRVANLIIITRVKPDSVAKDIRAGDAIVEINGISVTQIKRLTELKGSIILKIMPAPLHQGPSVYYRAILDYDGSHDSRVPTNFSVLNLKKGDVIQAFSMDSNWIQGRKVNDLNQSGLCPVNILGEQVSMLSPYGRRVLVLLGVPGVGRRTLKTMLLTHMPQYFATATPYTSRVPKPNELEGREYYFRTKEEMLERIRAGDMIEWGELDEQFYGTSLETIRSCIRSGRVCLLDCGPQALPHLYNAEFMPLVVLISPPEIDDFRQINKLRPRPYTEEQMKAYILENKKLMESSYAKMFHIVLVNRNLDVTFKRLMETLSELRDEVQWVPEAWLHRR
ncbi:MAGUK p55 subfamily member 7 [Loa loa]|uniref:MAGUK p55 subfamily member 7 n=1 Tax=Loa loa TaxID=7209 RepID=A0A1I7VVA7_LOALO|nr:MAGUK p55 subfamily member 7 [Loa loa]EJD76363.1 MAGUK p55 subfamily member 7 [Loa loa]